MNKITFSEQCYYVFGDLTNRMKGLSIQDIEGSEEDSLAPIASTAPSHIGMFFCNSAVF